MRPWRVAFVAGCALVQAVAMVTGGRLTCRIAGHEPRWSYGEMFGFDGPVCGRCGKRL